MNFTPFLAYVLVTTFTPGPNNILSMTSGQRYGYRRSLGFLFGICAGFCLVMLACGLLNVALVRLLPQVKLWLELLGAGYMLYLAVHILRSAPAEAAPPEAQGSTFRAGFAMQFLNLKVILYGVTVYAAFIAPAFSDPWRVSLFAPLLAGVGFLATSCWALGGDLFRSVLRRYALAFNLVMAGLLVYTAVASLL